jgi:thymidylate synthase
MEFHIREGETETKSVPHEETQYLECIRRHLLRGVYRPDRTGTGILSLFTGTQFHFDISRHFPLLTTKKVFFRGVAEELFFFLSGQTDVRHLQEKKVHIWDGNSSREYLDSIGQSHRQVGDLGKFYGFQWRHWGADYVDCHTDYRGRGVDQIQTIVDQIRNDPYSRRILLSAWNPADLRQTVLPPCHVLYQFYVDPVDKTLSVHMYQRSADLFLGVPFNLASTALLTYLLARTCDLRPGRMTVTLGDSHLYINHLEQASQQLSRQPYRFPSLEIRHKRSRLEDYQYDDLVLTGYQCHSTLAGKMAV